MSDNVSYLAEDGLKWTTTIHGDTYPAISSTTAYNLNGRAVTITGASNGVGKSTAISCARAGASYIILVDMVPSKDLEDAIQDAAKSNGKTRPETTFLELDITNRTKAKDAADTEVNFLGTFNIARYFLPLLLRKSEGLKTKINVLSIGALTVRKGASRYRSTKLALLRWTEFLHTDYGDQGLLAYCVHLGAILTELSKVMPKEPHANLTDSTELPADTMVWFAQERKEWLAGRYISCCWDMSELMERRDEVVEGDKLRARMVF